MSPNQNISIWMAPLPTEIPGTHLHITTPYPFFTIQEPSTTTKVTEETSKVNINEVNTNEDIGGMDFCHFTHDITYPGTTSYWEGIWKKNGKLYGRSSQSSQIIPTILQ